MAVRGRSVSAAPSPGMTPRGGSPMLDPESQRGRSSSTSGATSSRPPITTPQPNVIDSSKSAKVLYAYKPTPQDINDIKLSPGDIITNINPEGQAIASAWWYGTNSNGESGTFPSNYVELIERPPAQGKFVSLTHWYWRLCL